MLQEAKVGQADSINFELGKEFIERKLPNCTSLARMFMVKGKGIICHYPMLSGQKLHVAKEQGL